MMESDNLDMATVGFCDVFGAMKRVDVLGNAIHLMLGGLSRTGIDEDYHRALSHFVSSIQDEAERAEQMLERLVMLHAPNQVIPRREREATVA